MGNAEEPLVGSAGVETAEVRLVTADFHIIEKAGIARHDVVAGIPRQLELRMLPQMPRKGGNVLRLTVAPHEAHAGNLPAVFVQNPVQHVRIQRLPDVVAQMRTVTAYAPVRTVGEVHRKGHLIGNLLEDNIVVVVFQHGSSVCL